MAAYTKRAQPAPLAEDLAWQYNAACRGQDTEGFFIPDGTRRAGRTRIEKAAQAVCLACGVRFDCLLYALGNGDRYGVWGGFTEDDRTVVL
ncbi:MAG TPA: WhiB family transcriptional regulator [Candidatus Saccharimonadales bacterium]|nr:WhiB family transcriptional regulator [Candidatus Saccharimonadales bacterium]